MSFEAFSQMSGWGEKIKMARSDVLGKKIKGGSKKRHQIIGSKKPFLSQVRLRLLTWTYLWSD